MRLCKRNASWVLVVVMALSVQARVPAAASDDAPVCAERGLAIQEIGEIQKIGELLATSRATCAASRLQFERG
jgi:hypothetical protein